MTCCAGGREPATSGERGGSNLSPRAGPVRAETMVELAGEAFRMGSIDDRAYPADGESPVHVVELAPFRIDTVAVSNLRYAAFVEATGYVTDAERYGWSFVFAGSLPDDFAPTRGVAAAPWWRQVEGADWRHPEGPHSDLEGRSDHPVV